MYKFRTLVFMDTESTGLPMEMRKKDVQITEISLIAIHVKRFEEKLGPARVISKLSLCIQPRAKVSPGAVEMTGLFNINLECQPAFGPSTALLLKQFLEQFESPICLLAHNGSRFDFPLLRAELLRADVTLPFGLYCMDTLTTFQVLMKEQEQENKSYTVVRYYEEDPRIAEIGKILSETLQSQTDPAQDSFVMSSQTDLFSTPKRSDAVDFVPASSQIFRTRKRLDFDSPESQPSQKNPKMRRLYCGRQRFWPQPLKGFRLKDVYEKVLGEEMAESHQAEVDTMALLMVARQMEGFLEFVEYNAKAFAEVEPMWRA